MSTPFNVRQWAFEAGIETTGGFAVIAECVTLAELERFAHIVMQRAAATEPLLKRIEELEKHLKETVYASAAMQSALEVMRHNCDATERELATAQAREFKLREALKVLSVALKVGAPEYEYQDWCDITEEAIASVKGTS